MDGTAPDQKKKPLLIANRHLREVLLSFFG